nr:SUKH-3 domain-containing protein [uncultured Carboxylicivirga sp.]
MKENDKDRILDFLIGNESIGDFEAWLNNDPDMEIRLGSELYNELIGFNYNDKFVLNNFSKLILDNFVTTDDFETWNYIRLLKDSGWHQGRNIEISKSMLKKASINKTAINIIREFGGLEICETDKSGHNPQTLVDFNIDPVSTNMSKYGFEKEMSYFASAHDHNMYLYVDENDKYYMDNIAGDKLYIYTGLNFEQMIKELLRIIDEDNFQCID